MSVIELKSPEALCVTDERGKRIDGGNQYWYPGGEYVARRGCGPATAWAALSRSYWQTKKNSFIIGFKKEGEEL